MNPQPQTKLIDGETYTAMLLDAESALDIFERVMRLIGPAAFEALAHLKDLPDDLTGEGDLAKLSAMAPVAKVLFSGGQRGELSALVKDLCKPVVVRAADGRESVLDKTFAVHFQGRTLASMKVALFSLQVNFADFFGGLGALLRRAAKANASTSPKE